MDTKIFIIGHKAIDYGWYDDNALYEPIQVGSNPDMLPGVQRDNTGRNIHKWNPMYAESTATYWIANNVTGYTYLGQCQYRRRLKFNEDTDFEGIFSNYDAICCKPLNYNPYNQYTCCHSHLDMDDFREAIAELYPDMLDDFDKYITNGNWLYYSNSFVLRAEDYRAYSKFLFKIINWIKKKRGWTTVAKAAAQIKQEMDDGLRRNNAPKGRNIISYQLQVPAFLSERIFNLWVRAKCPRRLEIKYETFEGV